MDSSGDSSDDTPGLLPERLTRRENDILILLGQNLTDREIAGRLVLSLHTVKWYTHQVYAKLGVANRREAVAKARELGLIPREPIARKAIHNLPRQLSSLIGREKEIDQVVKMVWEYPLVTLTGAGGVGKTRLGLVAAGELVADFADGVWYVEFAAMSDPLLVIRALADAVGIREEPGLPLLDALLAYFYDRQALLVLDNCEHLVRACAALAQELLTHLPRLKIIATSREPLEVDSEALFRVPSLTFPGVTQTLGDEESLEYEAIRLFVERARAVLPGFRLTSTNAGLVAQICRRLDGIPLAIELAAARVRLLSVQQIAQRLDDAFQLLTGGRSELPRHRTLRAMIDWSYNLLSGEERTLLRYLSVFSGGWDLEAAEGIAAAIGPDFGANVLDLLGQLVDKSLVQVAEQAVAVRSEPLVEQEVPSGEETRRYHMLETIRQYGQGRLVECGELERARRLHLDYFLALVERIEPELIRRGQVERLNQLETELGNLRAALDWGIQTDPVNELRLALALAWFFNFRNRMSEHLNWLKQGLARAEGSSLTPEVRARALAWAGFHHFLLEERDVAETQLQESLRIYRELGPACKAGTAFALHRLAGAVADRDPGRAVELDRQGLDLAREIGDTAQVAAILASLAYDLWKFKPGNMETRPLLQESLNLYLELGDLGQIGIIYFYNGLFALDELDFTQARIWFEKCLPFFRQVGDQDMVSGVSMQLGFAAYYAGDWTNAIACFQKAVELEDQVMNMQMIRFMSYSYIGKIGMILSDRAMARDYLDRALAWAQTKNPKYVDFTRFDLGILSWEGGQRNQARVECERALEGLRVKQEYYLLAGARIHYGRLLAAEGETNEADTLLRQGLSFLAPNRLWTGLAIDGLACLAAQSQPERAARLFGAAEQINPYLLNQLYPLERAGREAALALVETILGEERRAALWAEGRATPLKAVVEYALEK